MVTKVPAELLEDDYVEEGQSIPVTSGGTGLTSLTTGNYIRAASASTMEERTPTQVRTDISAQPLDASLTALAGQNWAAEAIPVGTGTDTLTQLALAANRFPARSSAGSVAAKTITDFGLSLVDDADASTARTTLGLPEFASGTWTPTLTNITNVSSSTARECMYLRVGNTVYISGRVEVTATAAAEAQTVIELSLPIAPATFGQTWEAAGVVNAAFTGAYRVGNIIGQGTAVRFQYQAQSTSSTGVIFTGSYQVA